MSFAIKNLMILFLSDILVKLNKEMFWSKDFSKKGSIQDFKLNKNRLGQRFKTEIVKTNNKRNIGYDKFNKMGFYILSLRYIDKNKSQYVIVNKKEAESVINMNQNDSIILKDCPSSIDIYIERLQKNDPRMEKVNYDFDFIKSHEFYEIILMGNDGFKKIRVRV